MGRGQTQLVLTGSSWLQWPHRAQLSLSATLVVPLGNRTKKGQNSSWQRGVRNSPASTEEEEELQVPEQTQSSLWGDPRWGRERCGDRERLLRDIKALLLCNRGVWAGEGSPWHGLGSHHIQHSGLSQSLRVTKLPVGRLDSACKTCNFSALPFSSVAVHGVHQRWVTQSAA